MGLEHFGPAIFRVCSIGWLKRLAESYSPFHPAFEDGSILEITDLQHPEHMTEPLSGSLPHAVL